MTDPLTATVSISMKINLGNYESADAFLSVSGITQETTPEEIAALLDGPARLSFDAILPRLRMKLEGIKIDHTGNPLDQRFPCAHPSCSNRGRYPEGGTKEKQWFDAEKWWCGIHNPNPKGVWVREAVSAGEAGFWRAMHAVIDAGQLDRLHLEDSDKGKELRRRLVATCLDSPFPIDVAKVTEPLWKKAADNLWDRIPQEKP